MKDFIEYIAKNLVDDPDSVKVDESINDNKTILKLFVAQNDIGKIIGRHGKTIRSIRIILSAVATKHNQVIQLEINDD